MRALTSAPGAHRARLHRDVEVGVVEPPVADRGGGAPERDDLGVRGRVAAGLALVVRDRDDLVAQRDHRADRDLAPAGRLLGGGQRAAHEPDLLIGVDAALPGRTVFFREGRGAGHDAGHSSSSWPGGASGRVFYYDRGRRAQTADRPLVLTLCRRAQGRSVGALPRRRGLRLRAATRRCGPRSTASGR